MLGLDPTTASRYDEPFYRIEDYKGARPRWCPSCGDSAILAAVQQLCSDEQLLPEKTVFVSGIGCSSRFPYYMGTYGFQGLHGRALPIAEGIRIRRPDLHVFVNMDDGDCCSIGATHWIHAVRYNMNMVAIVHDNGVTAVRKMQASPAPEDGLQTSVRPSGAYVESLNILSATLGVSNVSFVANAVEWIPDLLYQTIKRAFHHPGFSFVRVAQRCPRLMPRFYDAFVADPNKVLVLTHEKGLRLSEELADEYTNQVPHDPSNIHRAREIASNKELEPVGILYQNEDIECYDEVRRPRRVFTTELRKAALETEFNKFAVHAGEHAAG